MASSFFEVLIIPEPILLVEKLSAFKYSIRSFREPLDKSVRQVMVKDIKEQFASGGNPKWPNLRPATVERKKRQGKNRGILVETGKLKSVATQISMWKVSSDQAYFSGLPSNVQYGYPLDAGFSNARTGGFVPAREFIRFTDSQREEVATIFEDWLDEREARHLS